MHRIVLAIEFLLVWEQVLIQDQTMLALEQWLQNSPTKKTLTFLQELFKLFS
jgi:hypothetical protein